jgi:hypothetical protein
MQMALFRMARTVDVLVLVWSELDANVVNTWINTVSAC